MVIEYNKMQAIFEYLKKLDNGKGKINTSIKATQLVFINCTSYKARSI